MNVLYAYVAKHACSTQVPHHGPPKAGEQRRSVLDCRKLQAAANWTPTVLVDEGLQRTVAFFAEPGLRRKTT